MKVQLLVLSAGRWEGKILPLSEFPFVIGRHPFCALRPSSPLIQPRHCALLMEGDRLLVRLFVGAGLTYVNDQAVDSSRALASGDVLKVGPLLFRVEIEQAQGARASSTSRAPAVHAIDEDSAAAYLLGLGDEDGDELDFSGVDTSEIASSTIVTPLEPFVPHAGRPIQVPVVKSGTSAAARALLIKYVDPRRR